MNTTAVSEDRSSSALGSTSLLRSIVWISLIFAAIKVALHIVTNIIAQHQGYGIFRDEMYYLICGQRLAFGYVDQPPMVALAARVTETLFGHDHMWSLRLIPALAGGGKGVSDRNAGVGARRRTARGGAGHAGRDGGRSVSGHRQLSVDELLRSSLLDDVRAGADHDRAGGAAGVSAELVDCARRECRPGAGEQSLDVFFLVCVLAALLLTPQRRILKSKWFGVAVLLMVVLALPNLLWQIHYHFPTLEWLRDVQHSDKDVKLRPLKFLGAQMVMLNPFTVLLWVSGVVWLLVSRAARPFRFLGVMYLLFLAAMMAMHAKDYYLAPVYPVFFAAGGVALVLLGTERAWKNALIALYALALIWVGLPIYPFLHSCAAAAAICRLREEDGLHAAGYGESRCDHPAAVLCGQVWMERSGGAGQSRSITRCQPMSRR